MPDLDYWTSAAFNYFVVFFIVVMTIRLWRIMKYPYKKDLSEARGDSRYGALYALTFAMLPWKKESTKTHWATYTAGMMMHLAVFIVFLFALGRRFGIGEDILQPLVQTVGLVGLATAFGLFIKRSTITYMKTISNFDDYFSNLLVDFYLLGGVLTAFDAAWVPLWRLAAILLFIWIPLGKIFHMPLFFVSRILFGLQFGRRGVIRHGKPITY